MESKADWQACCHALTDASDLPSTSTDEASDDYAWLNHALPALISRLWLAFSRGSDRDQRSVDALVSAAQRLIEANPQHTRRDELAQQLGVSAAALSRRFQTQLGKSLTAYRNHIRLSRALDLLEKSSDDVLTVALLAGFGSYPQFHRFSVNVYTLPRANGDVSGNPPAHDERLD